jgi:plasmid stability protein
VIAMLSLGNMGSIIIRRLDDRIKAKLRIRAASHGRSMEAEAREILKEAVTAKPARKLGLAASIRRHLAPLGGVELATRPPEAIRRPPRLTE